ncbi:MAG: thioredoxin domain-containing protein [Alphaproteobacteria bacterium]|nr:thioredoxin domain-containing protein [Alphaproteobacteria bacterium]
MSRNLLGQETSPYLLQHADNPVHWHGWNDAALEEARAKDKPILLSIGYAACHWCHVMAHESFENDAIAALMNELFVNIKVDREERPDLDTIYQTALALLGEQGGWPLTMFLTPKGEPFWGGTYFPATPRYGRPGFPDLLRAVAKVYRAEPERVTKNVAAIGDALGKLSRPSGGAGIPIGMIDRIAERLLREVDPHHGGIGGAPKFPQAGIFELLWRAYRRSGHAPYRDAVATTLTAMCQGGIYDHLGGGFARYSTDERWLAPHFEKMLYDNAALVELLTQVWQGTRDPLYATRVAETIAWVEREMAAPPLAPLGANGGGGFSATIDADSEGEEGKFYVWTEAEIDALLGDDAPLFKRFYDVTPAGNWEGHTILNRRANPEMPDPAQEAVLAKCRKILFDARAKRIPPGLDDKVLADWNGLMIAALGRASLVFDRKDWLALARGAFAFVRDSMTENGRLRHAWRKGRLAHPATLDDYANMIRAALALFEATGEDAYLAQARAWVEVIDRHYWDTQAGGYFFTADDTTDVIARTKTASDNAVPSGNGTMVGVLTRLYHLTGHEAYRARAEALVALFSGDLQRSFFPLGTLINNAEFLQSPLQIVVAGPRDKKATRSLLRAVYDAALPNAVIAVVADGAALPPQHPAHGKGPVDGKPAAYVCRGPTCSLPLTGAAQLAEALKDE